MSNPTHILVAYIVAINAATFLVYGLDKRKARRSEWRISEATLLLLSVIGGSVGAWIGMQLWHHKTRHKKFSVGIPQILLAQIVLLLLVSCGSKKEMATERKSTPIQKEPSENRPRRPRHVSPERSSQVFLVMYDNEVGKEPLMKAIEEYQCEIIYDYNIITGMALKRPAHKSLEETMTYFRNVKGVISVEYDRIYRLSDPIKTEFERQ